MELYYLTLCPENLLRIKDIPDHEIPLLSVVIAHSNGNCDEFVKLLTDDTVIRVFLESSALEHVIAIHPFWHGRRVGRPRQQPVQASGEREA
ncbi:hypothetical protein TNCV_2198681 [Trichonephila clavipes]|nr:hypothetical protein TNCV_2198681 [Trichonephila clavipes]